MPATCIYHVNPNRELDLLFTWSTKTSGQRIHCYLEKIIIFFKINLKIDNIFQDIEKQEMFVKHLPPPPHLETSAKKMMRHCK